MPKREKDIFSLYDPFIECGESLDININKKRSYGFYIGILIFFLILTASAIYEGQLKAIIFASLSIFCIAIICIVIYLRKNPVIVIDEKGIIKKEKFYSWEKIESIKFESASDLEGSDNIKIYLKELIHKINFTIIIGLINILTIYIFFEELLFLLICTEYHGFILIL